MMINNLPFISFLLNKSITGLSLSIFFVLSSCSSEKAAPNPGGEAVGTGGSMARFAVYNNYLYTVSATDLKAFDISFPSQPRNVSTTPIGLEIETIFPYKNNLFIGSQTGMFIYSLVSPAYPDKLSQFTHARGCDPVVAQGTTAYVTLKSGNTCGSQNNQLDVLDISNLQNPYLIRSYPMEGPNGLGVDDSTLFICDGSAGLKIYNAKDPLRISSNLLAHYNDIDAYDVIPNKGVLIVVSKEGIHQYDYTNPKAIKKLSTIPIAKP